MKVIWRRPTDCYSCTAFENCEQCLQNNKLEAEVIQFGCGKDGRKVILQVNGKFKDACIDDISPVIEK